MNFKTKLWVMFITIISLPVILTAVTFSVLSYRVIQKEGMNYGIKVENFTMWSDSLTSFEELRGKYPIRREFPAFNVYNANNKAKEILQNLGFNVK